MKKIILTFLLAALFSGQFLSAQDKNKGAVYPLVIQANVPQYPVIAKTAGVRGTVKLKVFVKNGSVATIEVISGPPLLVPATTDNIKSWRFQPETSATFSTTFIYDLEKKSTSSTENPKIELQLPALVKIIAKPSTPICMDCDIDIVGKPIKQTKKKVIRKGMGS